MQQVFYDPATNQVLAVYRGCRYGGTAWQDGGAQEIEAPDDIPIDRDKQLVIADGVVTGTVSNDNPLDDARKAVEAAVQTRHDELRASTFVTDIENAMRGKTYAEINAYIDGMTTQQRDNALKGLLLRWALQVR